MEFSRTSEQEQLRRTVRSFLEQKSPEQEVRRLLETTEGYDPGVWAQLSDELSVLGLAVPEEYGGSGFGFVEISIVLEEAGRALLCAPLLSSVMATTALLEFDDHAAMKDFLPGIVSGTIATLAVAEPSGRWDESGVTATAQKSSDRWRLSGIKSFVLDGHTASLLLVAARTPAGISLFGVDGNAPALVRTPLTTLDLTRKLAQIQLNNVEGRLIGVDGGGWQPLERTLVLASVALANEQAGVAQAAMDMAVQYAKDRIQFGRAIGSFQAIKHKCADLVVAIESAKSAAYYAASAVAASTDELVEVAEIAASFCSQACLEAAHENIQIHGGIGFTWEHPAHLYYKRAKGSEVLFGDTIYHRELLARAIGL